MSITENSILLRWLAGVWAVLTGAWRESGLGRFFRGCEHAVRRWAEGSGIWQFVWRDGTLPRVWPESISCRLFTGILNIPCAIAKWIYRVGKGMWDGSLAFRFVSALGGASFVFLGLLMLVMLIVPHSYWNNAYGLLGAVGVTALFVLGSAARPRHRLEADRLGPYMLFYLILLFYALVGSLSTSLSMRYFLFHVTSFLLVLLVVSSVQKYEQLRLVVALAVAGLVIASLYGCYQSYVGVEIVASQQDMSVNEGMPGRIYSFFDNPNNFAEILAMLIPLDIALFLGAKTWRGRFWSLAALVPCLISIGATYGRASWIGLAFAVLVMVALENWRLIPVALVLGVCAIPFLPETIYNRILTIGNMQDSSTRYRFSIYEATSNLMKDYWYRGVGLDPQVMQRVFQTYPTMFDGSYPIHTHNNYLQMWGETGILGLIAYVGVLLYGLKTGVKQFYKTMDKRVRHMLAASIGALCGIMVISVAEYTWFYPRNMFVYWFLFGVIFTCIKLGRSEQQSK